jgi:hypothetical protein
MLSSQVLGSGCCPPLIAAKPSNTNNNPAPKNIKFTRVNIKVSRPSAKMDVLEVVAGRTGAVFVPGVPDVDSVPLDCCFAIID